MNPLLFFFFMDGGEAGPLPEPEPGIGPGYPIDLGGGLDTGGPVLAIGGGFEA